MFVFGRIIHSTNIYNRMYKHFQINIFNIIIYSKSIYKIKALPNYIYMLNIINVYNVYTYIYIYVKIIFGK